MRSWSFSSFTLKKNRKKSSFSDTSECVSRQDSGTGKSSLDGDADQKLEPQDSATDPALMAAILESLRTHQVEGCPSISAASRLLCRNLSQADAELAGELRQRRAAQLHTSRDGITYFEHSEADYPLTLPSFQGHSAEVRRRVLAQLCNEHLQEAAEAAGVINCVPRCTQQLVLNTQGDGNCLSHACSLGVWGVHDRDSQLRGAIRSTMTHPIAGQDIKLRFELQLRQNGIPQAEWAAEWGREVKAFHSSSRITDRFLSDVHCFTLANVLRRPLVMYGDKHAALAGLTGIYLPLLWEPSLCCRHPVCVLFWGSHFSVLCTVEGEGPAHPQLLPLCTRDGPLQVRFLSSEEVQRYGCGGFGATGPPPLPLLRRYMDCEEIPGGAVWQHDESSQHEAQQRLSGGGVEEMEGGGEPARGDGRCHACSGNQVEVPSMLTEDSITAHDQGGECEAVGVRLSECPPPQELLHLLEAAFVAQAAAACWGGGLSRSHSYAGEGGCRGGTQGQQSLQ